MKTYATPAQYTWHPNQAEDRKQVEPSKANHTSGEETRNGTQITHRLTAWDRRLCASPKVGEGRGTKERVAANPQKTKIKPKKRTKEHQRQQTMVRSEGTTRGSLFGVGQQTPPETHQEDNPKPTSSQTGLPWALRDKLETLSGFDLSAVRVHYQSQKPAQLNAYSYSTGNEIYVGPGREKDIPQEAWHYVQKLQKRVPKETEVKGQAVNADPALEKEAEERRLGVVSNSRMNLKLRAGWGGKTNALQRMFSLPTQTIQRKEFLRPWRSWYDPWEERDALNIPTLRAKDIDSKEHREQAAHIPLLRAWYKDWDQAIDYIVVE